LLDRNAASAWPVSSIVIEGAPSSMLTPQPRSDHVQAPCNWSADFSIGPGRAFDGTGSGSNDDLGFYIGRPCLSPSRGRRRARGLRQRGTTAAGSILRPAGIQARGVYVSAIELAAVNAPLWKVSPPENRSRDENEPRHQAADAELFHELKPRFPDYCLKSYWK
jgi:hypothetical protein